MRPDEGFGQQADLRPGREQTGGQERDRVGRQGLQLAAVHDVPVFCGVARIDDVGRQTDLVYQPSQGRGCVQHAVGTALGEEAVAPDGADDAASTGVALQHHHPQPAPGEEMGGGQSGDPASHHSYICFHGPSTWRRRLAGRARFS